MVVRAQSFSVPADISGDFPGGKPLIAVDAKDNIAIAWSTPQGVFFTKSTDRGKTFAAPATISKDAGSGTAQLAVDRNGVAYLLWQGADMHFSLSRSTDGASFSSPADLSAALNIGTSSATAPAMALDANGNIDLAWSQFGSTGAVMFARSIDGGGTFSTPVEVGRFVYGARAQIAIGPKGDIDVLWSEQTTNAGDTCALRFSRSADSGATFSPTMTLNAADGACDAELVVDSAGSVNVLTSDGSGAYYRSADGGKSFSNSQHIIKPAIVWSGAELFADTQANIGAVVNSLPNHDILFSGSRDHGTFSRPILVSAPHPAPGSGGPSGGSDQSIAVDSSGNVNILWRDDILTPGASDIFLSRSTNGGASFSTAQNVSHSPGASNPLMAVDSAGNINMVWTAADRRVLFSRASVSTAGSAFTISVAPASLMVLPGGMATAQVTLTASSGSGQVISLGCGKLPPGAECTFNPPFMAPVAGATEGTVTVSVPPTLSTGGFPFTVNATSPTISQFQNMQISVGVLTGSVTPPAMTIPVGATANFSVTVASTGGFGGQVSLVCSAPVGVKCTFNPSSTVLPINGSALSLLTVLVSNTPATGSVLKNPRQIFPRGSPQAQDIPPISAVIFLLLNALAFAWMRGKARGRLTVARTAASAFLCVGLITALAAGMVSCGGARSKDTIGSGGFTVGTGGTSGISGTGGTGGMGGTGGSAGAGGITSGGVTTIGSTSVTFPLTVQAQAGSSAINVGTVTVTVP